MHILLPTIGSSGDVHPMIGLGETLQRRGHRVTVLTNGAYQQIVEQHGLGFVPLGTKEQGEALLANPDLWHPRRGFKTIVEGAIVPAMRLLYDYIAAHDPRETLVAGQTMAFGALLAHEKLGVPVATIHLQPSLIRSSYAMPINGTALPDWTPRPLKRGWWWLADKGFIDPLLGRPLNALRAELGLAPVERPFNGWIHARQRAIGLFPDWYAPPQPDWPPQVRLAGFPLFDVGQGSALAPQLREFLAQGEPPLLFTYGSAMQHGHRFFEAAVAAAQRLGRRAVLVTSDVSQLPAALPDGVRHEAYVPFRDLLPHVAAVVHHGGIGTLAQALAAGVPQLIVPLTHDQPDNARRIERLGAGLQLAPRKLSGDTLAAALTRLLDSQAIAARCAELAARIDGPAAREQAADWIEELKHTKELA